MNTVIHLLRHASHGHIGRVLTGRVPGVALTRAGRDEARALGQYLDEMRPEALYTSPRLRARQTAQIASTEIGVRWEIAGELDEIDFGCWSGMTFDELASDPFWLEWNEQRDTAATPAGETMRHVAARLVGFLERIHEEHNGGTVALVSHADVIKAGICHYLREPFQKVHALEIHPASLTTIAVGGQGGAVLSAGRCVSPTVAPIGAGVSA